jgi:hypothetical protein
MLIPNHPAEERLAALASHETDATADDRLTSHVASCKRCTTIIDELGALRSALAGLPDVAPSRPLRLLPPVEAAPTPATGGFAGWARRFFAPVLATGAALALVGAIGTAGMASDPTAQTDAQGDSAAGQGVAEPAAAPSDAGRDSVFGAGEADASALPLTSSEESGAVSGVVESAGAEEDLADASDSTNDFSTSSIATEPGSPWPIVLVAGLGLMIGALGIRWLTEPRTA